jgi:hypothetical protein
LQASPERTSVSDRDIRDEQSVADATAVAVSIESSPKRKRKRAKRLRAEERAWKAKNGPVITYSRSKKSDG